MLEKSYTPSGRSCRVTFGFPGDAQTTSISVLGEFNDWDPEKGKMKSKKSGNYELTVSLKPGASYRFRYLINGESWANDPDADELVANDFGTQDSVISV